MSQDSTSSTSGLVTPQKRSTRQSPSPQVPSPLTKMYSPVPVSSSRDESPVPLSLKGKTKSVKEHVQNAYGETNTLIKAALYIVSKNDNKGATTELDKLKRINQCHEQKTLFLISELNKEINNHDQLRRHYQHEKFAAEAKVERLEQEKNAAIKKVEELQKTYRGLSVIRMQKKTPTKTFCWTIFMS